MDDYTPAQILDRMAEIAANDMLVRGKYFEPFVSNHNLAESGAVCMGHRACAIGALWLAAGVKPGEFGLPGVGYAHVFATVSVSTMKIRPPLRVFSKALTTVRLFRARILRT